MPLPDNLSRRPEAQPDVAPQPERTGRANGSLSGPTMAPWAPGRTWSIILTAGLLAGLGGFGIGEAAPTLIPPALDLPPEVRASRSQAPLETERRMRISRDRAATLAYGGLGAVLGFALGAAGGLARRSTRAAIAAALTGVVLGGAAGAGATMSLLPSYHAARASAPDEEVTNDLALALRTHGGIWLAVGAAAGLALGLGLGGGARIARATIGGILGAALAAVAYEFAGGVMFPVGETFRPMAATAAPRLLAHLSVALCVSAGAFWAVQHLRLSRVSARRDHQTTRP
jgi:hypothetical protein